MPTLQDIASFYQQSNPQRTNQINRFLDKRVPIPVMNQLLKMAGNILFGQQFNPGDPQSVLNLAMGISGGMRDVSGGIPHSPITNISDTPMNQFNTYQGTQWHKPEVYQQPRTSFPRATDPQRIEFANLKQGQRDVTHAVESAKHVLRMQEIAKNNPLNLSTGISDAQISEARQIIENSPTLLDDIFKRMRDLGFDPDTGKSILSNSQLAAKQSSASQDIFKKLMDTDKLDEAGAYVQTLSNENPYKRGMINILDSITRFKNTPITTSPQAESAMGWPSGIKEQFDFGLLTKNKNIIQNFLPRVPKEYLARFSNEISNIIGKL